MYWEKRWSSDDAPAPQGGTRRPGKITLYVGLLFLLAGLLMVGLSGFLFQSEIATSKWPQVDVTIESSQVIRYRDKEGKVWYRPDIMFSYLHYGQKISADTFSRIPTSSGKLSTAQAIVDPFRPGQTVPAFVNPEDPAELYLNAGKNFLAPFICFGLGIGFVMVGGTISLIYWASARRKRRLQ